MLNYSVRVTRKSDLAEVRQHQRRPTIANPNHSRMVIKSITVYNMTNASKGSMATFILCEQINGMYNDLMREIIELFCVPATSLCPLILALASVAAACNRYPQATTTVLINGFYPKYGPLISAKTHIIIYACSIHPQYLDNSCSRMC